MINLFQLGTFKCYQYQFYVTTIYFIPKYMIHHKVNSSRGNFLDYILNVLLIAFYFITSLLHHQHDPIEKTFIYSYRLNKNRKLIWFLFSFCSNTKFIWAIWGIFSYCNGHSKWSESLKLLTRLKGRCPVRSYRGSDRACILLDYHGNISIELHLR